MRSVSVRKILVNNGFERTVAAPATTDPISLLLASPPSGAVAARISRSSRTSSSATREPVSGQRRYTVGRETPARRATSVNVVRRTPNSATQSRAASKIAVSIGEEAAGASGRVGAAEVADAPDGTA